MWMLDKEMNRETKWLKHIYITDPQDWIHAVKGTDRLQTTEWNILMITGFRQPLLI